MKPKPPIVYRSHFERLRKKPKKQKPLKTKHIFLDESNLPFVPP